MEIKEKGMTFKDVQYLKDVGELNNVKVSAHIRDGIVCLHMRDYEFVEFEPALRFLQEASRDIVHASHDEEAA